MGMLNFQTKNYLYKEINEVERNILQHNLLKPTVQKLLPQLLEEYGLRQRLEAASQNNSQVLILEAGSGSGSFLEDLADFLDEKGLLEAANLNGVDLNVSYVLSSEQQNRLKPSWAKLNYYQHDINLPLEENFSLKLEKKLKFDCICAMVLVEYLPNARQQLLNLYSYLKPGGVLYLCDLYLTYDGEANQPRIIAPNPVIDELGRMGSKVVRSINGGEIVAAQLAGWLQEAGAEQVQVVQDLVQTSGGDKYSLDVLRYFIAMARGVTPILLSRGLIDQACHDKFLSGILQLERTSFAQIPFVHTLARKPL